jgi:TGS domain-containing protein/RelA/SpoT family protein
MWPIGDPGHPTMLDRIEVNIVEVRVVIPVILDGMEVQVRTHAMHRDAELGIAAHWRYKEGGGAGGDWVTWLKGFLAADSTDGSDSGAGTIAPEGIIEHVRAEALKAHVYVLTPRGWVIELPRGATALDFAYAVHTEVGHRCRGAKAASPSTAANASTSGGSPRPVPTASSTSLGACTAAAATAPRSWWTRTTGAASCAMSQTRSRVSTPTSWPSTPSPTAAPKQPA